MTTRIAYRTKQVIISLSKPGGFRWVEWIVQKLIKDNVTDEVIALDDYFDRYHKRIDLVMTQMHTATDPVTGQEITISTVGLEMLIKSAIVKWTLEEGKLSFDPVKDELVDK